MSDKFKVGDHVRWNSEAGHVSGRIIAVHTEDFDYKGYTHHASKDESQCEIRSDGEARLSTRSCRRRALQTPGSRQRSSRSSMRRGPIRERYGNWSRLIV